MARPLTEASALSGRKSLAVTSVSAPTFEIVIVIDSKVTGPPASETSMPMTATGSLLVGSSFSSGLFRIIWPAATRSRYEMATLAAITSSGEDAAWVSASLKVTPSAGTKTRNWSLY